MSNIKKSVKLIVKNRKCVNYGELVDYIVRRFGVEDCWADYCISRVSGLRYVDYIDDKGRQFTAVTLAD